MPPVLKSTTVICMGCLSSIGVTSIDSIPPIFVRNVAKSCGKGQIHRDSVRLPHDQPRTSGYAGNAAPAMLRSSQGHALP